LHPEYTQNKEKKDKKKKERFLHKASKENSPTMMHPGKNNWQTKFNLI
jgi:hypothetical protein